MKKFLYRFKAGKAYIDYLCETAIKEGIFNKKVTEKVGITIQSLCGFLLTSNNFR